MFNSNRYSHSNLSIQAEDKLEFTLSKKSSNISKKISKKLTPWRGIYLVLIIIIIVLLHLLRPQPVNYDQLSSRTLEIVLTKLKNIPLAIILNILNSTKQDQLEDRESFKLVERESNVAALYWLDWATNQTIWKSRDSNVENVTYCDWTRMVPPDMVSHSNLYWQMADVSGSTIYLYNAYYDNRALEPVVQVITATDRQIQVANTPICCQLWFDKLRTPIITTITEVYNIWPEYWDFGNEDGVWGPQIMTCPVPKSYRNRIPRAISIQPNSDCSQPTNVLRVIHNKRNISKQRINQRPSIGICVKAFRFRMHDVSVRLVEWLEMVRIMGGEKVYFYVYGATESMYSVLRHYANEGFVNWRHLTLPGSQPNIEPLYQYYYGQKGGQFWPQELLELNDCLYRNLYRHDYVIVFDIDEMIVPQPQNMTTWHQLLERVESEFTDSEHGTVGYLLNKHAYVYELFEETSYTDGSTIPEYLYMMRHTYRGEVFKNNSNIKCFHRTKLVSAVHNHFPMRCLNTTGHHSCHGKYLDPVKDSLLMHFRQNRSLPEDCDKRGIGKQCTVHDQTIWKYRHLLEPAVKHKLEQIFKNSDMRR